MSWPDILIAAIAFIATIKGYKRGFIMELSGAIALVLSLITPWLYNGAFDSTLERALHLGPGSAHVVAMSLVGIATYVAVLLLARVLSAVAKMPVIGFGNAIGGALIGLAKAVVVVWIVLYIALFFPLSRDIRADLRRSTLVSYITFENAQIDGRVMQALPWFARPLLAPVFARHRV